MRILLLVMLSVGLAAAEDGQRIDALLADLAATEAEQRAKLLEDVAALKQRHDQALARERSRAIRDLQRLATRVGPGEQVLVQRAILRLDRDDQGARAYFEAIGSLEQVLAELVEEAQAPESAVDLLAIADAPANGSTAAGATYVTHSRDWPLVPGLARPAAYGGLLTANQGAVISVPLVLPRGDCYLHIRYAAQESRPMDLFLNGVALESGAMTATSGSWQPDRLCWHSVGPITSPGGEMVLELRRAEPSPHLCGVVVSRSPQPPAEDPLSQAAAGITADQF